MSSLSHASGGATVAVAEAVHDVTEQYLLSKLLRSLALLAVFGGLSVLAIIEVRSRPIFIREIEVLVPESGR
ncbi:MAG: hypothetical protein ACLP0B_14460 [Steroidobacteraceae bacterium]|jgi:hypothetical protein